MSLKGRPCFQRRKREVEKGVYIFLGFHQIGTADSLTEQLTYILLEFNTQVGRKKNPADNIWYKTFQRQLSIIEFGISLNCFFLYQLPLKQTDFSSVTAVLADLSREPGTILYVCYSLGKTPLCCPNTTDS